MINKISKDLIEALVDRKPEPSAYDTSATVTRIEGDTAWVHIAGGVDETPVQLTIDCKAGDTVQVRVAGGTAWIVGNKTAPPTDDTTAIHARTESAEAQRVAKSAEKTAEEAGGRANKAYAIAADTNQYFWFTPEGTDTGAHITEVPQDEFTDPTDPNYHSGGNLLARSNGIAVRNGLTELATFGANGMDIIQNGKSVASFGSTLRLGSTTNISGDDETPSSYLQIEEVAGIGTALKFMGTVGSHGMGRIDAHNYVTPDDDYREFRIIGPYGGENSPKIIFDYDGASAARGIDIWLSDTKRIYISNTGATVMAGAFFFDTAVEAPAFKADTHVHATAGAIGEYKSANNSAAVSLATSTAKALTSISLTAGTWVVVCHARFPNNATGYRRLNLSTTSGVTDQNVSSPAVNGNTTDLTFTRIMRPTATTTFYLNGWQNSGSTLSMPASQQTIIAVRIA